MAEGKKILSELEGLEEKLKYRFQSHRILVQALTHSSRANEEGTPGRDYEVLEFLGDAVLSFVSTEMLYHAFPDLAVGDLSRLRAHLVNQQSLAEKARRLGLGEFLRLGKSERSGRGSRKPSLLADVYEAVLAALFLDGGLDPVRRFLERELRPELRDYRRDPRPTRDPKTRLQEMLQTRGRHLPVYRLVGSAGPPHARRFSVSLQVGGRSLARGTGRTKKEAEQQAATRALERFDAPVTPAPPAGRAAAKKASPRKKKKTSRRRRRKKG